ncbi:MAG: 50S ribosomal protein L18 [Planctomycetaceae bacterium]
MKRQKQIDTMRKRRKFRVRNHIRRTAHGVPRLSVFRSNNHIYAQIIDDLAGSTIVSCSTLGKADLTGNREGAAVVGKELAQKASEKGIQKVVFDRGAYRYHGRIAALADAAREAGLQF